MNLPTGAKTTSIAAGPTLPAECRPEAANVFFKTTSPIGMHQCLTEGEWSEVAGGVGGSVSLTENQIGFGSASDEVTGNSGFTFDPGTEFKVLFDDGSTSIAQLFIQGGASGLLTAAVDGTATLASVNYVGDEYSRFYLDKSSSTKFTFLSHTYGTAKLFYDDGESNRYGLVIPDISGRPANYAIKTGAGDIQFASLAGSGSRAVVVDSNGKLSAP